MFGSRNIQLLSGDSLRESLNRLVPKNCDPESRSMLSSDIEAMAARFETLRPAARQATDESELQPICLELRSLCESPLLRNMHEMALVQYIARIENPFERIITKHYMN